MPLFTTDTLKKAVQLVRSDPDGVAALDAEEVARQKAQAAEAKRQADARAAVDKALPARIAAIAEDWAVVEAEAIAKAVEALAREQLEHEKGITPWQAIAVYGAPAAHLTRERVDRARTSILATRPVPWNAKLSTHDRQIAAAKEANAHVAVTPSPAVTDRATQREASEARRQEGIAARKAAARASGALPPVES